MPNPDEDPKAAADRAPGNADEARLLGESSYQVAPPLTDEEYAGLKADIAENGVRVPVVEDEDGNVIGHTKQLGLARYKKWEAGNTNVYVQDGSFVKLREVTVSYQLPEALLGGLRGVRDARISLTGRNLGMWTDYWSFDPEVNNFGNNNVARFVDLAPFPPSRQFFFSVDVGF